MSYVHVGPPKELREPFGKQLSGIRVVVDYNADETVVDRYAAILEIKDYSVGSGDTITIDPSDATAKTWEENVDFNATSDNETTANNITSAINGTADYVAKAVTGHDGNPFVYITYAGGGHIDSASSGDTSAWAFYEVNTSNGTVAATHSDRSGTIKKQPLYTDTNGLFDAYLDRSFAFDLDTWISGYDIPDFEDVQVGVEGLQYDRTNDEVDLTKTFNANSNTITNVSTLTFNADGTLKPGSDSINAFQFQNAAGDSTILNIDTISGRVGINKTDPSRRLHVVSEAQGSVAAFERINNNKATIRLIDQSGRGEFCYDTDRFAIYVNDGTFVGEIMSLRKGNMGIGMSHPTSKLALGLPAQNLGFVDAGSIGATEQDWVKVKVGGTTGYIRVYASK